MTGHVRLHRQVRARLVRELKPTARLLVTDLLALVNWAAGSRPVNVPGHGRRPLERGELVTSCAALGEETGLGERTVRRWLHGLGRLPWLSIELHAGRAGSAGVYVRLDVEAMARWGGDAKPDRPKRPVSTQDRPDMPVTAPDRTIRPAGPAKLAARDRPDWPESEALQEKKKKPAVDVPLTGQPQAGPVEDTAGPPMEGCTTADGNGTLRKKARAAVAESVRGWPALKGFRNAGKLKCIVESACSGGYDKALNCVAYARSCRTPAKLLHCLQRAEHEPPDSALEWAKHRLNGGARPEPETYECCDCGDRFTGEPAAVTKIGAPVCRTCHAEGQRLNARVRAGRKAKKAKKARRRRR